MLISLLDVGTVSQNNLLLLSRYCPHCANRGLKTKVKKFKLDPKKDDLTIMCKNAEVTFILMSLQLMYHTTPCIT